MKIDKLKRNLRIPCIIVAMVLLSLCIGQQESGPEAAPEAAPPTTAPPPGDIYMAPGGDGAEAVIGPDQGVEFQQVDFEFTEVVLRDSNWGQIQADPLVLADSTWIEGGFLNVFTTYGWPVQNLPLSIYDDLGPITAYFNLGLPIPPDILDCTKLLSENTGKEHIIEEIHYEVPEDEYIDLLRYELDLYITDEESTVTDEMKECAQELLDYLDSLPLEEQYQIAEIYVTSYYAAYYGGPPPDALSHDVTVLSAYVTYSEEPLLEVQEGFLIEFPVESVVWNAEGVGGFTTGVGTAPPVPTISSTRIVEQHILPNPENVQTARHQCFPMSIANSLQYLENTYGLSVPNDHEPGLEGDDTLVGQLDTESNRSVISRENGSGVWFTPMLRGKFSYLNKNGLKDALVHTHQGRGYGTQPDQALPDGDFTEYGITSTDDGATVTLEWIRRQIEEGNDIELVFSFDDKHGNPTGGHAVRVVGFEIDESGAFYIYYVHDRVQSNDGIGLETVRVCVQDLDGDGFLNLGSPDREIRFALSESMAQNDQLFHGNILFSQGYLLFLLLMMLRNWIFT